MKHVYHRDPIERGRHYEKIDHPRYKYKLIRDVTVNTELGGFERVCRWYTLDSKGNLLIRSGYAWDGASGPTLDTQSAMRGSLVHDAIYQMLRTGELTRYVYDGELYGILRSIADTILRKVCVADGMPRWRAWYWWGAVRLAGGKHTNPRYV